MLAISLDLIFLVKELYILVRSAKRREGVLNTSLEAHTSHMLLFLVVFGKDGLKFGMNGEHRPSVHRFWCAKKEPILLSP